MGLKDFVASFKARRRNGIICNTLFDAALHDEDQKCCDDEDGTWRIRVKRSGTSVQAQTGKSLQPTLFPLFRDFDLHQRGMMHHRYRLRPRHRSEFLQWFQVCLSQEVV